MRAKLSKLTSESHMPENFICFYAVGLILFMLPFTRGLFITITPLTLLLVIGIVLYFHKGWDYKTILFFTFIFISSFILEMQGTTTGKIFGEYYYDRGLGLKINHTPLIIGLNWLFLVYASHDISYRVSRRPIIRIFIASLLMLLYDFLLEWVAPYMEMWHFEFDHPPLQNYITWFVTAFIFHSGFELLRIRTNNRSARMLFFIQALFFILLGIYSIIVLR